MIIKLWTWGPSAGAFMHDLMELVTFIVDHSPALWQTTDFTIPQVALQGYWVSAKSRFDRWASTLKELTSTPSTASREYPFRNQLAGVLEEILTNEILTRIWTAALSLYDQRRNLDWAGAIGQSVFLSQLELRVRSLGILNDDHFLPERDIQKLLQLCERNDRWCDLLLSRLSEFGDVSAYAVDPQRWREFSADFKAIPTQEQRDQTWRLMRTSLLAAYALPMFRYQMQLSQTALVAGYILDCFPQDILEACQDLNFYRESRFVGRCHRAQELLATVSS